MCLNPIWIKNPRKIINKSGGIKYNIQVECGCCCECIEKKKEEANMRAYYECLDTFRSGGYILFDTLTYNNENLPHVSEFTKEIEKGSRNDFSCYRTEDIRKFVVRLRRYAERKGIELKNNMKYFIASEYGDNKEYIDDKGRLRKGTERPHYHVLLFIKNPNINVYELSELIWKSWRKGKCDGIQKGKLRVDNNTFSADNNNIKRVCNYVSKYVGKDLFYNKMVEKRLKKINVEINEDILRKQMSNFYRWSEKFGIYGIEYNSEEMLYNGKMRIPHEKRVWKEMPLAKYLERKLYYTCVKGKWELNEIGKIRKIDHIEKNIDNNEKRINDILENLKFYSCGDIKKLKYWRDELNFLFDGRTTRELAEYLTIYKGRLVSDYSKIANVKDDIKELILNEILSEREIIENGNYYFNYTHAKFKKLLGNSFISNDNLDDIIAEYEEKGESVNLLEILKNAKESVNLGIIDFTTLSNVDIITAEEFNKKMTIDQYYNWEFRSFDTLLKLLNEIVKEKNKQKQKTYEQQIKLKKKLKNSKA